jgi:hypothetical protein
MPAIDAICRVNFNIPINEYRALKKLATSRHETVTDTIRKAIHTEIFLEENENQGCKLLLEDPNGLFTRVIRK